VKSNGDKKIPMRLQKKSSKAFFAMNDIAFFEKADFL